MEIKANIKKWGNSLGLLIPREIVDNLKVEENTNVILTVENNRLMVTKAIQQPSLEEILNSIPDDFEYPQDIRDFSDSPTVGNELL
jgi:antitoxin MazE